eukprot:4248250-Pyramimonas_sp.AAC.1
MAQLFQVLEEARERKINNQRREPREKEDSDDEEQREVAKVKYEDSRPRDMGDQRNEKGYYSGRK